MPRVYEKLDGDWFVRAASRGRIATIQITQDGRRWLRRRGVAGQGDFVDWDLLSALWSRNYAYTNGGAAGFLDEFGAPTEAERLAAERRAVRERLRISAPHIRLALQEVFGKGQEYRAVLRVAALAVREANAANPSTWSALVADRGPTVLGIVVGRIEVLAALRSANLRIVTHMPWLSEQTVERLRHWGLLGAPRAYKSLPRARPVTLEPRHLTTLYYPRLQRAHHHVIRAMSYYMDSNPYRQNHSAGAVRLLRRTGFGLPQPAA